MMEYHFTNERGTKYNTYWDNKQYDNACNYTESVKLQVCLRDFSKGQQLFVNAHF